MTLRYPTNGMVLGLKVKDQSQMVTNFVVSDAVTGIGLYALKSTGHVE